MFSPLAAVHRSGSGATEVPAFGRWQTLFQVAVDAPWGQQVGFLLPCILRAGGGCPPAAMETACSLLSSSFLWLLSGLQNSLYSGLQPTGAGEPLRPTASQQSREVPVRMSSALYGDSGIPPGDNSCLAFPTLASRQLFYLLIFLLFTFLLFFLAKPRESAELLGWPRVSLRLFGS